MNIVIELKGYYDWEPHPSPDKLTDEEKKGSEIKQDHTGKWLQRVVRTGDTHTSVSLPEAEIQDCLAHFKRRNEWPDTREDVVAWYLASKTMPHHAHPSNFVDVKVEGEPEVEARLKSFFKVGGK